MTELPPQALKLIPTETLPHLYALWTVAGHEEGARAAIAEIDRRDDEAMRQWYEERGLTMPPPYFPASA